jgi:spore maturation protein CgeB
MKKLKIFLVMGGGGTTQGGSKIWIHNFYDSLIETGHHIELFDPDEFLERQGLRRFTHDAKVALSDELPKIFSKRMEKTRFDYFISYLHSDWIYPDAMDDITKHVFTVNYTTNFHQFPIFREIGKKVHLNIYITKAAKDSFESLGVKSYWMPLAANPRFYRPSHSRNSDVVFVGLSYGSRPYMLWRVLQNGIALQVYGPGWMLQDSGKSFLRDSLELGKAAIAGKEKKIRILNERLRVTIIKKMAAENPGHLHEFLADEKYAKIISEAGIVINSAESRFDGDFLNHRVLLGCNLRDFEVTMSGSCLCTQYSDELPIFFEEEKEVISFRNEYELVEKLKFYSLHVRERDRIAAAGHKRALRDHTWKNRFEGLFSFLK